VEDRAVVLAEHSPESTLKEQAGARRESGGLGGLGCETEGQIRKRGGEIGNRQEQRED
jgi:hypothetical protein